MYFMNLQISNKLQMVNSKQQATEYKWAVSVGYKNGLDL